LSENNEHCFKIENIAKSYNGKPVLANCSFSFDKKGIYVLRGSNGAGKSTLLRICALLEKPDKGKISFYSSHGDWQKTLFFKDRSAWYCRKWVCSIEVSPPMWPILLKSGTFRNLT
jgi:ABC-type multidrug transport system ATPase subunit